MADAKARLTSLFQGNGGNAQGNDALRYVAPKEPTRSTATTTTAAAPPATTATSNATPNTVVYNTTVSMYQYDTTARKYNQLGTAASNVIGCVLIGAEVTYAVLFYNADKVPLCEIPIKAWKPTVQPKAYMNFYDDKGTNWSIKFASDDAVSEFMKHVFCVKMHVEIWSPTRSIDANTLWKEDLGTAAIKSSESDGAEMRVGDTVGVEFQCWRVVGNAKCSPMEIMTKYPPFEKAIGGELRKFRIGDGSERIKALDESVVGMKRGGKRMVLAPPGKTNGQDWYLIEVTVVKSKTGGSSKRESISTADQQQQQRRATTTAAAPAASSSSSKSRRKTAAAAADLVPYDEEPSPAAATASSLSAKDELELKELRLLQREKQLEMQAQALRDSAQGGMASAFGQQQQQQPQQPTFTNPYASSIFGSTTPSFMAPFGLPAPPAPTQQSLVSVTGRPLDGMIMELHAKMDYLIRMTPTTQNGAASTSSAASFGIGATDVQGVLRGVERLAGENERLLLQINSQNQQYVAYERRCEELVKQMQRVQDEKRVIDEKYQALVSQNVNYNSEITSLTSARDAAITQTNRMHAEYQQLLAAYYQKQQGSSESEEQRNELNFERQARVRLEKELSKETQSRSLVEQELALVKKQQEVFTRLKESEWQTQRQEMEKHVAAIRAKDQQEFDDRLRKLTLEMKQQESRLQEEWTRQMERVNAQSQAELQALKTQISVITQERDSLGGAAEDAERRAHELKAALQAAQTAVVTQAEAGLADEEKRIYQEQIELLQAQVKQLEAEQFVRVQEDLANGRLSSPTSSPRHQRKQLSIVDDDVANRGGPCSHCSDVETKIAVAARKEEAAERTLTMAQELKREAEAMIAQSGATVNSDAEQRDRLVQLFKEAVNEMFFRFQDLFEDEEARSSALDAKQVLTVIRKVLKQSTKDVVQRLTLEAPSSDSHESLGQADSVEPTAHMSMGVSAASMPDYVTTASTEDVNVDEPPPPPEKTIPSTANDTQDNSMDDTNAEHEAEEEEEEDGAATDDDLLFGAASVSKPTSIAATVPPRRAHESDDDEDDDFED